MTTEVLDAPAAQAPPVAMDEQARNARALKLIEWIGECKKVEAQYAAE